MTKVEAIKMVAEFERAVIEANHKMANDANKHFVARKRGELVAKLTGESQ